MKNFRKPPCVGTGLSLEWPSSPNQSEQRPQERQSIEKEGVPRVLRHCDLDTAVYDMNQNQKIIAPWPRRRQAVLIRPRSRVNDFLRTKNQKSAPQLRQQLKSGIKASALCITVMACNVLTLPQKARKEGRNGSHPTPSL